MNKTVNINLAGTFFHIDENAYLKLQRYLEAIKHSFTDSQGRIEILSDIEARIAELFTERIKDEKQVVSVKEVEDVVAIMGQPEDYLVDEEIFEDEPSVKKTQQSRKLFRDKDNAYIGGVSAGLGHYFGIDALWIRLAWVILFFGFGTGILIYILLWILMPVAETTADKLAMSGKPVNITNIEQKVKEGFSNVKEGLEEAADKIKNQDYEKIGNNLKSSSRSFFEALGNIIIFFFKIIAKLIGVILIITGAAVVISLFISLFSAGTSSFFNPWWMDYANAFNFTGSPFWLIMLLTFFLVGIPFFFIFYLGLKILVSNLKSIGNIAKLTLLGLWLVSLFSLIVIGIKGTAEHGVNEKITQNINLPITATDTLTIKMANNNNFIRDHYSRGHFEIINDEDNNKKIYSSNIRLVIRSTKDTLPTMTIGKYAEGRNYQNAQNNANAIDYNYEINGNTLLLNSYLLSDLELKFRNQKVDVTVFLPEGSIFYADNNTYDYHSNYSKYKDILKHGMEEHYLKVIEDDVICLDCKNEIKDEDDGFKVNINIKDEDSSLKLDENGLKIKDADVNINVTTNKTLSNDNDNIEVKIDSSGINIKSKDNN